MTEPAVRAKIADGLYIEFASKEDAALFTANAGDFNQFKAAYQSLYQTKATTKDWRRLTTAEKKLECLEMMQRTCLTNGLTLYEAVRQKVVAAKGGMAG